MLEWIQELDVSIILFFNQTLKSEFLDFLFPYFTNLHKIFWIKFIIFPFLAVWWLHKTRISAIRIFLALILTAGVSDLIGYRILKPSFNRVRPNNNPNIQSQLRLLRSPGSPSFPSNHSMNSFAVGTVAVFYYPYLAWIVYPLAAIIAMFRMYAGVHYFTDILGGAIFGILLGYFLFNFVFKKISLFKK
ncbi:MAG: phosphatase PAP2 family protein [Bdellovibrionales bacterium]|nr:phosphatase PAP2 family protein [Bdellovibrionales bacterium]